MRAAEFPSFFFNAPLQNCSPAVYVAILFETFAKSCSARHSFCRPPLKETAVLKEFSDGGENFLMSFFFFKRCAMIERTEHPKNESVHAAVPLEMRVARDGRSDSAFSTEVKMRWLKTKHLGVLTFLTSHHNNCLKTFTLQLL